VTDPANETPYSLAHLHEGPWSKVEGAFVRVRQVIDTHDPLPPHDDNREGGVTTEVREGELVGRANGKGLYYDAERAENVPTSIGPTVYLDTPEETTLEVRTDKSENKLLAFERPDDQQDGENL